jgi:ABC-type nitrate/sulfonate/bicarbonate transport system substrate-binding protein
VEKSTKKLISLYKKSYQPEIMGQVIGVVYLWTGAKMPEKIKKLVLASAEADEWAREDEEREDRVYDLIKAVKAHKPGRRVELREEGVFEKTSGATQGLGSYGGWWSKTIMGGDTPLDLLAVVAEVVGAKFDCDAPDERNFHCWDMRASQFEAPGVTNRMVAAYTALKQRDSWNAPILGQVIGATYLWTGARIPAAIAGIVLEAARADQWANEGDQERQKYIGELMGAIQQHKPGQRVDLEEEGLFTKMAKLGVSGFGASPGKWTSDNGKWSIEIAGANWHEDWYPDADGYIRDNRTGQEVWFTAVSRRWGHNFMVEDLKLSLATGPDVPAYVEKKASELANLAMIASRNRKTPKRKSVAGWGRPW